MKFLWAFLMIMGLLIAPSGQNLSFPVCIITAIVGVIITIFSGGRFVKEMDKNA